MKKFVLLFLLFLSLIGCPAYYMSDEVETETPINTFYADDSGVKLNVYYKEIEGNSYLIFIGNNPRNSTTVMTVVPMSNEVELVVGN